MSSPSSPLSELALRYLQETLGAGRGAPLPAPASASARVRASAPRAEPPEGGKGPMGRNPFEKTERGLSDLLAEVRGCAACALGRRRRRTIEPRPAAGPCAWMVLLDPAGATDEVEGRPLGAPAEADLFSKIRAALKVPEDGVHVTSILKCAMHYVPARLETLHACLDHLAEEIRLARPARVTVFGETAGALLFPHETFPELGGRQVTWKHRGLRQDMVVTHGLTDMLVKPEVKRATWRHLQHQFGWTE